jgi:hypothetical protein
MESNQHLALPDPTPLGKAGLAFAPPLQPSTGVGATCTKLNNSRHNNIYPYFEVRMLWVKLAMLLLR